MSILKRTQSLMINTNMYISKINMDESGFTIQKVIDHLVKHKDQMIIGSPVFEDLYDVCISSLMEHSDETVRIDEDTIVRRPKQGISTFFHESCRIIRVDFTNRPRAIYIAPSRIKKSTIENGYVINVKPYTHTTLIIKIERMTDTSCFTSWTLVR